MLPGLRRSRTPLPRRAPARGHPRGRVLLGRPRRAGTARRSPSGSSAAPTRRSTRPSRGPRPHGRGVGVAPPHCNLVPPSSATPPHGGVDPFAASGPRRMSIAAHDPGRRCSTVIAPPHCLCCRRRVAVAGRPGALPGCMAAIERSPGRLLRAARSTAVSSARLRGRRPAARCGAEVRRASSRRRARCGADRRAGAGRLARGDPRPGAGIAGTPALRRGFDPAGEIAAALARRPAPLPLAVLRRRDRRRQVAARGAERLAARRGSPPLARLRPRSCSSTTSSRPAPRSAPARGPCAAPAQRVTRSRSRPVPAR